MTSATTRTSGLCQAIATIERVTITRTITITPNRDRIHFAFPAVVTVDSRRSAQLVASSLCSLPNRPSGILHCPADLGVVYRLAFFGASKKWRVVAVEATGCQFVRGLGVDRWVAPRPKFWNVLGAAMGLTTANQSTFAGTFGN